MHAKKKKKPSIKPSMKGSLKATRRKRVRTLACTGYALVEIDSNRIVLATIRSTRTSVKKIQEYVGAESGYKMITVVVKKA